MSAELVQRLREKSLFYSGAADTIDAQSATISNQAATINDQAAEIVDLKRQLVELQTAGDLKPHSLSFLGRVKVPSVGMTSSGLAFDPAAGWWYTIGAAGNDPFGLYRFKIGALDPATLGTATNVENLGAINVNDVLKMTGKALVSMKGLLWEGNDKLLLNYGSYYANGFNTHCLARYDVVQRKVVEGPWMVPDTISSETVKGMTLVAPPALAAAIGRPLVSFGVRGSTPQKQSWGLGLVGLDSPAVTQPVTQATIVSHWPMKIMPGITPVVPYSDYPGDENFRTVYLQRAADGTVTKIPMTGGASMHSACFVNNKTLVVFGSQPYGYQWYGNQTDFTDVPSLIDPSRQTIGMSAPRGGHVEAVIDKFWFFRVDDIIAKFTAGDKLIQHYATGRITDLGGGLLVPLQTYGFGQLVEVEDKIYGICHGAGNIASPHILAFKTR